MKKFFLLVVSLAVAGWLAISAVMPGTPKNGECEDFHPHTEEFARAAGVDSSLGGQVVLKVLDWLSQSGKFSAWVDTTGRTIVSFTFNGKAGFIAYGQGNPTMFLPEPNGINYIRFQTKGMKKINSEKGLASVKNSLSNCLRASYAAELAPVKQTASIPATAPMSATTLSLIAGFGLAGIFVLGLLFKGSPVTG